MSSIKLDDLLKIGTEALQTTAQTLCGAINELKAAITAVPTVSFGWTGTASSTGIRKQQITIGSTSYDIDGTAYMEQSVQTSTSDSTLVTFTNAAIEADSVVDVFVEDWDILPENVACAAGTCVVTLPKVDTAAWVFVRITLRTPLVRPTLVL